MSSMMAWNSGWIVLSRGWEQALRTRGWALVGPGPMRSFAGTFKGLVIELGGLCSSRTDSILAASHLGKLKRSCGKGRGSLT